MTDESTALRPALADEQRPGVAGGLDGEALRVDEPDAGLDRVDAEPRPGELAEGQARDDLELDRAHRPASSSTVRSATAGDPGTA